MHLAIHHVSPRPASLHHHQHLIVVNAGQYGYPMLIDLPDIGYFDQNKPDIAHNLSCVLVMVWRLTAGKPDTRRRVDRIHRAECELRNVFPDVWAGTVIEGSPCLPWRLDPEALQTVDDRVRALVYPHNCVTVGNEERSFWRDMHCASKMSQRIFALMNVIPTCLRGYVPLVHRSLLKIVWGLRILDGNVYSFNRCTRLGIEPGSHCLWKAEVAVAHKLIVTGLSLMEGCVPVSVYQ